MPTSLVSQVLMLAVGVLYAIATAMLKLTVYLSAVALKVNGQPQAAELVKRDYKRFAANGRARR